MSCFELKPMTAGDHNAIYEILRDPGVRLPFALFSEQHFNPDTVTGWCTLAEQCNDETSGIDKFYVIRDGQKIIGYFGGGPDTEVPEEIDRWEIGYFLAAPYHGRGIITGVLGDFKQAAQKRTLAKTFFAAVSPGNHASRRVLEKNNFTKQSVDPVWAPYVIQKDGSVEILDSQARPMDMFECRLRP